MLRAQFVGAMEESSQPNKSLEMNPHSRFIIGSVSEDNSEDETSSLVKLDLLEEKERSLSPVSVCSDSLSDLGLSNAQEGLASHMRYGSNSAWLQSSVFLPHPFQRDSRVWPRMLLCRDSFQHPVSNWLLVCLPVSKPSVFHWF